MTQFHILLSFENLETFLWSELDELNLQTLQQRLGALANIRRDYYPP